MTLSLLKRPSALVPLGFAVAALTLPYIAVAIFGPDPTGDEGIGAHLWQLFMVAQVFSSVFFVTTWAIREPKQTVIVLALHVTAFLAAAAPIYLLGL